MTREELLKKQGKGVGKRQPIVSRLVEITMWGLNLPWQSLGSAERD